MSLSNLKILVVDDNERLCKNLVDILDVKGYEVTTTYDGSQAIEIFQNNKFDVVLMDVKMPGISGIETLKILKQIAKDIFVIMITAFADDIFYKQGLSDGDFEVIQKPMDIDRLLGMLENIKLSKNSNNKEK